MSNHHIVDATENDVESLVTIYSSPHLYHNREEALWLVKSFFDYHHIKLVKRDTQVIGANFWKVVEEKHHGLTEIEDFWIDENHRRRGFGEKLLRSTIEDMQHFFTDNGFKLRKVLVTTAKTTNQQEDSTKKSASSKAPFSETCSHKAKTNSSTF